MRLNFFLMACALLSIIGLTFYLDRQATRSVDKPSNPEIVETKPLKSPEFSFKDFHSGQTYKLTDFKGKVVLLNFWASWCAPCVVEFPKLEKLAREHPDTVIVIAASVDTEAKAISNFITKLKFSPPENFYLFHDDNRVIAQDMFQTIRFPETVIIDPSGQMIRKVVGDTDWNGSAMNDYLSGLASQKPIP